MIHVVDFEKTAFSTPFRGVSAPSGPQISAESGRGRPLSGTRETWLARFVAAFAIPHPPSAICHLPFAICHLPFLLPHSPFRIPHSAFSRERKGPPAFWHPGNLVGPQRPPGHCSPAPRPTPHAPRRPGPAGSGPAQTLPHWRCLTPTADLAKIERGPISTNGAAIFSMSPNQAIPAERSIRFAPLAAAQPLNILSRPETLNTSGSRRLPDGHQPQCPFSH